MNPSESLIETKDSFISTIAKCLSDAVGDDISHDIKVHRLVTQNSTPSRIWDLLNTNICERFTQTDVIANPSKRGGWELVPVFERNTDTIYSLMREQRFETLKKQLPKRRNAHYVDAFVRSLNKDLRAPQMQTTLFQLDPIGFRNESHIKEIVQKILSDLGVPNELVKRHALILFKSYNNELSSLRCCVVDSNLNIVDEADWSNYIRTNEGVIADKVAEKTSTYNNPSSGLKLTQKAKDKLGQKNLSDSKTREKEKEPHDIK